MTHSKMHNLKILFFPFTHITDQDLNTILAVFPKFHYLSINQDLNNNKVLKQLREQNKITPHFISSRIDKLVGQNFQQYLDWAKIHKGNEQNLKLLFKETPYFTNDSDITAIKSHIIKNDETRESAISQETSLHNKLLNDLLFLKMAQLHDEQHENIDLELKNINKNREELVSNLRCLDSFEEEIKENKLSNYSDIDSRTTMIQKRLLTWSNNIVAMEIIKQENKDEAENEADKVLFVTTNEEVFSYLESNCKDIINIFDNDNIKAHENRCQNSAMWQCQFETFLMDVISKNSQKESALPEVNDNCHKRLRIKICSFYGGDVNQNIFNVANREISVCLIKIKR